MYSRLLIFFRWLGVWTCHQHLLPGKRPAHWSLSDPVQPCASACVCPLLCGHCSPWCERITQIFLHWEPWVREVLESNYNLNKFTVAWVALVMWSEMLCEINTISTAGHGQIVLMKTTPLTMAKDLFDHNVFFLPAGVSLMPSWPALDLTSCPGFRITGSSLSWRPLDLPRQRVLL